METVQNPEPLDEINAAKKSSCNATKKTRFSPTVKGAMIGALAGNILPVFGTFSGALLGGIAGKLYTRRQLSSQKSHSL